MGTFVISQGASGVRFNLKADNGQVILTSESYTSLSACEGGIESVRKNSQIDERYDKQAASDGRLYFNLKASNGQTVGTSQMYADSSGRQNGIASVKENAPEATVIKE